jgi:hypothetical protein
VESVDAFVKTKIDTILTAARKITFGDKALGRFTETLTSHKWLERLKEYIN